MHAISNANTGQTSFGPDRDFNGVKVFTATMMNQRDRLGDTITDWMHKNSHCEIRDAVVTQSSDEAFHCISITLFFWENL